MMSHPAMMDRKSVALESRCLKKAAGSFPGSPKTRRLDGESKCPILILELIKCENSHFIWQ